MTDTNTFLLPRRTDSERAIISIILINSNLLTDVIDKIAIKDFYHIWSQQIWKAIVSIYRQGAELDVVTLSEELKKYELDPTVALKELSHCYENDVSDTNLHKFIADVKNASLLRKVIASSLKHSQEAQIDSADAKALLVGMEKDILAISDNVTEDRSVEVEGILDEVNIDIKHAEENGWTGYSTGLRSLDRKTGGLISSQVWIVGAYTGTGKTFFILNIMLSVLEQGGKVILFSTEMDRKIVMFRLLGTLSNLGVIQMLRGRMTDEEKARKAQAEEKLRSYRGKLFIYDSIYTVEEMQLKIKKHKLQSGVDVVILDFLQNLKGSPNIYERMSNAALDLQRLAHEQKVCLILVSQVSQASADWSSRSESIDYKGAGEIAMIADVGLWLTKDKDAGNIRWIYLRKVRHGEDGKIAVSIDFPGGKMSLVEEENVDRVATIATDETLKF